MFRWQLEPGEREKYVHPENNQGLPEDYDDPSDLDKTGEPEDVKDGDSE